MPEEFIGNEAMTFTIQPKIEEALRLAGLDEATAKDLNLESLRLAGVKAVSLMARALSPAGQGQPGGAAWVALKPATIKAKSKSRTLRGNPEEIGVHSGHMRRSLIPDSRGYDLEKGNLRVLAGPTMPYSLYFSKGTRRGVPARPLPPEGRFFVDWWSRAHSELIAKRIGGR